MGVRQGDESSRFEDYEGTVEFRLVLGIAEAFREEFGVGIDAHPGGEGHEAGVVNRAFRGAIGVILGEVIQPDEMSGTMTRMLRGAALRRLSELDVAGGAAEQAFDSEPGPGDGWLTYLALAPASVIEEILGT